MNRTFSRRRDRLLVYQTMREGKITSARRVKCSQCGEESANLEWDRDMQVCPKCGFHAPMDAYYRLSNILDPGSFQELEDKLSPADPLAFPGYPAKLAKLEEETGLKDAAVSALGKVDGRRAVFVVLDSRFLMGSMGTAVGEKVARAAEWADKKKLPLIIFSASGGGGADHPGRRVRRPKEAAAGDILRQRRGPDAGGNFFPDADGQNRRRHPALSEPGRAVHLLFHPPYHRRGDGQFCVSGGHHAL